jgi:hypothetical protein
MRRFLPLLIAAVLTACSTAAAPNPTATPGTCAVPLRTAADVKACNGTGNYISSEDVSIPGKRRVAWRYSLADESPSAIVEVLGSLAQTNATDADEVTIFLFGSDDQSMGYNRGRVVVTDDGSGGYSAAFDICTKIGTTTDSQGTFQTCDDQTQFTAPINP